jgi:hypothetical protein
MTHERDQVKATSLAKKGAVGASKFTAFSPRSDGQ